MLLIDLKLFPVKIFLRRKNYHFSHKVKIYFQKKIPLASKKTQHSKLFLLIQHAKIYPTQFFRPLPANRYICIQYEHVVLAITSSSKAKRSSKGNPIYSFRNSYFQGKMTHLSISSIKPPPQGILFTWMRIFHLTYIIPW